MSIHRRFAPIGVRFEPEQVAAFTGIYRYIVSWEISTSLELAFSGEALKAALRRGLPEYFNIGQGSQFASKEFTSIINEEKIQIRMDGKGRVIDNIFVERFWRTLKYEEAYAKYYEFAAYCKRSS